MKLLFLSNFSKMLIQIQDRKIDDSHLFPRICILVVLFQPVTNFLKIRKFVSEKGEETRKHFFVKEFGNLLSIYLGCFNLQIDWNFEIMFHNFEILRFRHFVSLQGCEQKQPNVTRNYFIRGRKCFKIKYL